MVMCMNPSYLGGRREAGGEEGIEAEGKIHLPSLHRN